MSRWDHRQTALMRVMNDKHLQEYMKSKVRAAYDALVSTQVFLVVVSPKLGLALMKPEKKSRGWDTSYYNNKLVAAPEVHWVCQLHPLQPEFQGLLLLTVMLC